MSPYDAFTSLLCSTQNNDKYPKYVRKLVAIQAFGDFCVLATKVWVCGCVGVWVCGWVCGWIGGWVWVSCKHVFRREGEYKSWMCGRVSGWVSGWVEGPRSVMH